MRSSSGIARMTVASRYHVLFRERSDGHWDYFPKGHKGPGYQVNTAQRERLLQLIKYERFCYVIAIMTILVVFALMAAGALGMWFLRWGWVAMPLMWFGLLSPIALLNFRRRRALKDAAPAPNTMTLEELRFRAADLLPTLRILLWLLFFLVLVACSLAVAYAGYVFDDSIMIVGGVVLASIYGRSVWNWALIYRLRCHLHKSRQTVPFVFD